MEGYGVGMCLPCCVYLKFTCHSVLWSGHVSPVLKSGPQGGVTGLGGWG